MSCFQISGLNIVTIKIKDLRLNDKANYLLLQFDSASEEVVCVQDVVGMKMILFEKATLLS